MGLYDFSVCEFLSWTSPFKNPYSPITEKDCKQIYTMLWIKKKDAMNLLLGAMNKEEMQV